MMQHIQFPADMVLLLTFMSVWNMLGAVLPIPALSALLRVTGKARRSFFLNPKPTITMPTAAKPGHSSLSETQALCTRQGPTALAFGYVSLTGRVPAPMHRVVQSGSQWI